jgi:hypothetical protein
LISKRSEFGKIIFDFPLLAVVEAKKDNFSQGWAQCCLEMIAIQKMNQNEKLVVYGLVSNGEVWEIAKLEHVIFTFYPQHFIIGALDDLFNALVTMLELCKQQLMLKHR